MVSRWNLKCKMAHFEGKIVNHASREMLCWKERIYFGWRKISLSVACTRKISLSVACKNYASVFKVNLFLKNIRKHKDWLCYGLWLIHRWYSKISVVHEYRADTFLRTLRKGRRGCIFFCNNFIRGEQTFFQTVFFSIGGGGRGPLAMSYHMINFALSP